MHAASGVGVRCRPLCAATGHGLLLWARCPHAIWAADALPPAPAALPALGGAPELRSLRSHVAMAMHMAAAYPPTAADVGRHRQQRGGIRQSTLVDVTSTSLGAIAGACGG